MGMYEEAVNHYQQAELHTLTEKQLPCRSLRIIAESYAIKGSRNRFLKTLSMLLVRTSASVSLISRITACQLNKGMIYIYYSLVFYIYSSLNNRFSTAL